MVVVVVILICIQCFKNGGQDMKISKDAYENYIFLETTPDLLSQNFLDTTEDSVFKQFSR